MRNTVLLLLLHSVLLFGGFASAQTTDAVTPAKALDVPVYKLSPEAVAAGIDGKLTIGLRINSDGSTGNVWVYGTPMWPCGSPRPDSEIEGVIRSVKEQVLAIKFSPEMKDGKPRSTEAEITLSLSRRFAGAARTPRRLFRLDDSDPGLVDVGPIESLAEKLEKPFVDGGRRGPLILQILVSETGKVTHAGFLKGAPPYFQAARDAVCSSTFRTGSVDGKRHQITGLLTYIFQ